MTGLTASATVTAVAEGRQTPYLKHGKKIDTATSIEDALRIAGLDWEVEKVPAYDLQDGVPVEVPGRFVTRRKDTKQIFDVVGSAYTPISNMEALGFGDSLSEVGGAKFVAAGETAKGRGVWVAFELPEEISFGGNDPHKLTGLLEADHSGKRAVRMHIAPMRLICTNMMNVMVKNAVQRFSIHHTSKASERIQEAAEAVGLVQSYVAAYEETGERLLKSTMGDKALDTFLTRLIPERPKKVDEVAAIKALAMEAETNEFGRGTSYAALNAVREYYDHGRPTRTTESAFIGAYTGVNAKMTNRALEMLENRAAGRAM